jgi:hypothetical protein
MAELTQLEGKLAEVIGLAQAAQGATSQVAKLVEDKQVQRTLQRMGDEAKETAQRGVKIAGTRDGKKTALLKKARETKGEATEMMETYLAGDADGLEGLEFLIMAEAGELGHVEIVNKMNEKAKDKQIGDLAKWALKVQTRHFDQIRAAALKLAAKEDPNEVEE